MCVACRETKLTTRGKCFTCTRHNFEWHACHDCGDDGPCAKLGRYFRCTPCARRAGRSFSANDWDETPDAEHAALLELHRTELWPVVDVWLVPCGNRCALHLVRLVLWRLCGRLAGLLEGPPAGVLGAGGRNGRTCNALRMAKFLEKLVAAGRWPLGDAPVLLTGVTPAQCAAIRIALAWSDQSDRLRAYRRSLSRHRAVAGWSVEAFLRSPRQHSCSLVVRAKEALDAAGVTQRSPRRIDTPPARSFLLSLYGAEA